MANSGAELQVRLDQWINRLKQVDRILAAPVKSLIWLYGDWKGGGHYAGSLPAYVTAEAESPAKALLIHAVACGTIERLYNRRRRYQWLSDDERRRLTNFQKTLPDAFLHSTSAKDPLAMVTKFEDEMFGALNPLTSSEILGAHQIRRSESSQRIGLPHVLQHSLVAFPKGGRRTGRCTP